MASMVNADTDCGFASADVLSNPTVDGAVGGPGSITFTVEDCTIDADAFTFGDDCNGDANTASGSITVSGTRTIAGTLTGDAAVPVVPGGPDAVTIALTAVDFTDFRVDTAAGGNALTMATGSLSATVKPRLAVDTATGACSIATPNVTFEDISYGAGTVVIIHRSDDDGGDIPDVPIEASSIDAQNGAGPGGENTIGGTMTVFDAEVDVPEDGDDLDPDYDASAFVESFSCTPGLGDDISYTCADLTPRLADGAARLSVKAFGSVVSMLNANDDCGFESAAVLQSGVPSGTVGGDGSLTLTVTDCAVTLPAEGVAVSTDCGGVETILGGTVSLSGTKTVSGRFTGGATTPVIPNDDEPATFDVTVTFTDFSVASSADANALRVRSGAMAGQLTPRTALSGETGACSIASPNSRFQSLTWTDGDLAVTSASGTFNVTVSDATIDAVNGSVLDDAQNELSGSLTIDGTDYDVPSDGLGLNPTFDAAAFEASWSCAPELVTPVSHQCLFIAPIAYGASQLTARTFGTVTSLIDADTTCGFSSAAVAGTPTFDGNVGDDQNTAVFTIGTGCTVTVPNAVVSTDCSGAETTVNGSATVTGTKTVVGYQTGNPLQPVVPTSRDAVTYDLTISFDGFEVLSSTSTSSLTATSGTLTGQMSPRTALDLTTGACSIATPNARFTAMAWDDAELVLASDDNTFDVTVSTSSLDALNGTRDADSNTLSGTITADGVQLDAPAVLNPDFDQAAFDAGFACVPNQLVPDADAFCSFRQALGEGASRLLVKHAGVATSILDGDTTCGYSSAAVGGAALGTLTGTPGNPGTITLTVDACTAGPLPADTALSTNCLGTVTHGGGAVTLSGTKFVAGLNDGMTPIVPVTRDAATFTHTSLAFDAFTIYDLAAGETVPAASATVTGDFSVTMNPIAGESIANNGVYPHATPVAEFSDLQATTATMTLVSEGSTFNVTLTAVDLDAFNGSYDTQTNAISGSLTVDGQPVMVPAAQPLDPAYDQAIFDSGYFCAGNPDLLAAVPAAN